jgi:hypothetical protein
MDQWLAQWKPTDISFTTLVAATFAMFWVRVWPWLTKEYFPARRAAEAQRLDIEAKRDERDAKLMADLAETMVEIKTLVQQNVLSTNPLLQAILDRIGQTPITQARARKSKPNQKAA